jgi:hypothetical protein
MVKGFKDYNKGDAKVARMSDFEVLKMLFPSITKKGDYPSLEIAKGRQSVCSRV